ncbi:hypothetical protein RRG08_055939 [Elysia crispata]|uniref:Uncharacterized protein n=1 Tax=Elysia crispata TaxID=231223 RepID=A0AAE1DC97_9GAST|nr:hypothetical protein RRG08_055939 [Elysia crispata]
MKFFLFICSIGALGIYPLNALDTDTSARLRCVTNYKQFMMKAVPKGASQETRERIFCEQVRRDMSCFMNFQGKPSIHEKMEFHSAMANKMQEMNTICKENVGALHHNGANTILGPVSVQLVMISAAVTWAGKVRP